MSKSIFLLVAYALFNTAYIQAQIPLCNDTIAVYLNKSGTADYSISENVLDNSLYDSVSPSIFSGNCSSIGLQKQALKLFSGNELLDTCYTYFNILDTLAPDFENYQHRSIRIKADDTITLSEKELIIFKEDNCGINTIEISPNVFDTSSIGQTIINITITDSSGNSRSSQTTIDLIENDCEKTELRCNHFYKAPVFYGPQKITYDDLVYDQYALDYCAAPYTFTWLDDFGYDTVIIPDNTLDESYIGEYFKVYITDTTNGDYCHIWVYVNDCIPIEHPESYQFLPTDVTVNLSCHNHRAINFGDLLVRPDDLSRFLTVNFENLDTSFLFQHDKICGNGAGIINDTLIITDSTKYIRREWIIVGQSGNEYTHFQKVFIQPGPYLFEAPNCTYDHTFVNLWSYEYVEISKRQFLADNNVYICTDSVRLSFLDENRNPIDLPQNRIYRDIANDTLYAVLTSLNSGKSCTTSLSIIIPEFSECFKNFIICDTLPRGQIFDDCDSSYTTTDRVEWPKDVTVSECTQLEKLNPEHLLMNKSTAEDAYPKILLDGCDNIDVMVSHSDNNNLENRIIRKWKLHIEDTENNTWKKYSYGQIIHLIENSECEDGEVYISSPNGMPMQGVKLGNSLSTNDNGIAVLDGWEDRELITPTYSDSLDHTGVTLEDLNLLFQSFLTKVFLNPIQRVAADVDKNGIIDFSDYSALKRHLQKGEPLNDAGQEWVFVSLKYGLILRHEPFLKYLEIVPEYSESVYYEKDKDYYRFIGVRLGDLNSTAFPENANEHVLGSFEDMRFEKGDEIIVPLDIIGGVGALSLEFKLHFDNMILDFQDITEGGINSFEQSHFRLLNDTTLIFDWSDKNAFFVKNGQHQASGMEPLINIHFIAKEDGKLSTSLDVDSVLSDSKFRYVDNSLQEHMEPVKFEWKNLQTSTNWLEENRGIKIYPNPVEGMLYVSYNSSFAEPIHYSIMDISGTMIIKDIQLSDPRLDVGSLQSGIYFLVLNSKVGPPIYFKFAKQ